MDVPGGQAAVAQGPAQGIAKGGTIGSAENDGGGHPAGAGNAAGQDMPEDIGGGQRAEAGPTVDFADSAATLHPGAPDVRDDQVDAGDVQPHRGSGPQGEIAIVRMNRRVNAARGAADGDIDRPAQPHEPAGVRHAVRGQAGAGQQGFGLRIERQRIARRIPPRPAIRFPVEGVEQGPHRSSAIPGDAAGMAFDHRDQIAIDHGQPVFPAVQLPFHQDMGGMRPRPREGPRNRVVVGDGGGDADGAILIGGLHHHRIADPSRDGHGLGRRSGQPVRRDRQAGGAQQGRGRVLAATHPQGDSAAAFGCAALQPVPAMPLAELINVVHHLAEGEAGGRCRAQETGGVAAARGEGLQQRPDAVQPFGNACGRLAGMELGGDGEQLAEPVGKALAGPLDGWDRKDQRSVRSAPPDRHPGPGQYQAGNGL